MDAPEGLSLLGVVAFSSDGSSRARCRWTGQARHPQGDPRSRTISVSEMGEHGNDFVTVALRSPGKI